MQNQRIVVVLRPALVGNHVPLDALLEVSWKLWYQSFAILLCLQHVACHLFSLFAMRATCLSLLYLRTLSVFAQKIPNWVMKESEAGRMDDPCCHLATAR
jgi:hypothetical protein